VYLLSVPIGGALGAFAFYLGAIASFGLGMVGSLGIGRYWWHSASIGLAFGFLQAPVVCSLRNRGRLAVLLPGLAMFCIWLVFSVARRPLDFSMPFRVFKITAGQSLIWGLFGGLAAYWTRGIVNALEQGVSVPRRARNSALVATGIALVAVGLLAGGRQHGETDEPKRICRRFAEAFAAGDENTALNLFNLAPGGSLTPHDAHYWFDMAKPFLPVGGRVEIIGWRYRGPRTGWCECKARVVGATYRLPPQPGVMDATFEVRLQRYHSGWRVDPPERAIETYLAGLYGEEAGRAWQRFLLTTPGPER
jgi:hypothetical protein